MGEVAQVSASSWCRDTDPMVLGEIFSSNTSVAVWHRDIDVTVSSYFEQVFTSLGMGVRAVFSMGSLRDGLNESLPDGEGKCKAVEDIYLLSDMLTCLFDCNEVGLRLAPLTSAMCPKFHTDNIPVRLVNTYLGSGTEWLPLESIHNSLPAGKAGRMIKSSRGYCYHPRHIQQLETFDAALLKGSAWDNQEHLAAVHRSCRVNDNEKRVLLTLDPM